MSRWESARGCIASSTTKHWKQLFRKKWAGQLSLDRNDRNSLLRICKGFFDACCLFWDEKWETNTSKNVYEQCMHAWIQQSEDWDHQGWFVTNRWRFFRLFSFSLFAVNCSIRSWHPRNKTRICSISMLKLGHVSSINHSRVRIMRALTGGVAFAASDFTCGQQIWATAKFCYGITTTDLAPLENTP